MGNNDIAFLGQGKHLVIIGAMQKAGERHVCWHRGSRDKRQHGQGNLTSGLIDGPRLTVENLTAMARAGSDIIITYHGREVLQEGWL